jgi:hypothetical protein
LASSLNYVGTDSISVFVSFHGQSVEGFVLLIPESGWLIVNANKTRCTNVGSSSWRTSSEDRGKVNVPTLAPGEGLLIQALE